MPAPIVTNQYRRPGQGTNTNVASGYRFYGQFGGSISRYRINNGFFSGSGPQAVFLGATMIITVGTTPADLSTLIITAPNGKVFTFQFQYTVGGNPLFIKIPLPAGGASTTAQVITQMLLIMGNALAGVPLGFTGFPWNLTQTAANAIRINYTVAGTATAITGTTTGVELVSSSLITSSFSAANAVIPGIWGKNFAFLSAA